MPPSPADPPDLPAEPPPPAAASSAASAAASNAAWLLGLAVGGRPAASRPVYGDLCHVPAAEEYLNASAASETGTATVWLLSTCDQSSWDLSISTWRRPDRGARCPLIPRGRGVIWRNVQSWRCFRVGVALHWNCIDLDGIVLRLATRFALGPAALVLFPPKTHIVDSLASRENLREARVEQQGASLN